MNAPDTSAHLATQPHTNAAWHQRRLDATPRGVGVMGDFFIERAKNAEFW
ncbi:MAG: 4-aminobutyrate--2-oxoglutarate transaminase, partial [Hydrogenophaga sp.]|nr:4-aminobutyrate--2-oxoglutarate transaminase [Hydrogenophaga sp.]